MGELTKNVEAYQGGSCFEMFDHFIREGHGDD